METVGTHVKQPFWIGFRAGLVAGVGATGAMLLLSILAGGLSLPEVLGAALTLIMPLTWFEWLHQVIGADAKYVLFACLVAGQCVVFALSGAVWYRWIARRVAPLPWHQGLLLGLMLWLLVGFVLLPLTGAGIFGAHLAVGFWKSLLSLALVGVVFAGLYVLAQRWLSTHQAAQPAAPGEASPTTLSRRAMLKGGAALVGLSIVGASIWRIISVARSVSRVPVAQVLQQYVPKIVPPPRPNYGPVLPTGSLSPEITPNDQYYVVSKNLLADPTIDASTWQLTLDGQVEQPLALTYQALLIQPMQQQYESMLCISNEVGGPYISNALWEGIPLKDLLQQARVKPGATKVVFHTADDYSDSIHLAKALEPTTLLAVRMNGVPLPEAHGFPARLLVPGIYGLKHCKWITHIEVVNYEYQGWWQQRGWSDAAPVRETARIDTPLDGAALLANHPTFIAGVAFSGNKSISQVDVSTDAGKTWKRATLKQPLSGVTWVLWELAWTPPRGSSIVIARAIDLEGNVQSPRVEQPLPNGSSGYHSITIMAS
jgi:DMSO/TMAO reductase YedYZ molybdopterin-dependent catalytic subunit